MDETYPRLALGIAMTIQSGLPGGSFFHGITTLPLLNSYLQGQLNPFVAIFVPFLVTLSSTHDCFQYYYDFDDRLPTAGWYLITYVRGDPESLFCANLWGIFVALSPQAIILRVSMGSAWSKETITQYGTEMTTDSHLPNTARSQVTAHSIGSRSGTTIISALCATTPRTSDQIYNEYDVYYFKFARVEPNFQRDFIIYKYDLVIQSACIEFGRTHVMIGPDRGGPTKISVLVAVDWEVKGIH
ncbi:hypothetical protein B0H16DRAFT_1465969 [Mycena metata]|uniref:Uncharacterized protein n=1 Tax=Mycena metata TaxID=1033252 RepID=A0AAD7MZT6_9AGAR|nr:hypothetical protein B0H16DRAFT_1465969 [Mycena metata]